MQSSDPASSLLGRIDAPSDLHELTPSELVDLSHEIRGFLIESVSKTGGHLGPNLGVVELTIALHRVFDSPRDTLIFDTGHQAYVHKLLTGRKDFSRLRSRGGLSGYPSRAESIHDVVESSHASASIAWADGISWEKRRQGDDSWTVAIIGDGALTGGMAWEALNRIAASKNRRVMVVINDNGRSYAPTTGGLAHHLDAIRTSEGYERALAWGKRRLLAMGEPGRAAFDALHGLKAGLKDVFVPQVMFEDLGLKYLGPVDGHDIVALEDVLRLASGLDQPVLVHAITQKGRGYVPAEENTADRLHAVGPIHPETGLPVVPERFGWTSVFAEEITALARENPKIVGVTAAMMEPVGLALLKEEFPARVIDVGIAEQEALASAAGMAYEGAHPVIALYATFLNRAFDQLLMDAALHRAGVTLVLDRAGITGADGASHNGVWDIAMCQIVPGLELFAPRDESTLRECLRRAVAIEDRPTVLRYRKGALPEPVPRLRSVSGVDVVFECDESDADALLVASGSLVPECLEAARALESRGVRVRVVDPVRLLPVKAGLAALAAGAGIVLTVEDGIVDGGFGWAVRELLADQGKRVLCAGVPKAFLAHGERPEILSDLGLDATGIEARILEACAGSASR
ncbi:1-deoxy-D-xylulose-5-phosphate synthase [Schaalia hyovaginalis]|uniref:1-deoxy-D-xylulose-5-phosphate synthase n=1 Tax=Schaalia hyovaginalis TaxID=29316 RepID=UPI0026EC41A4|nr:1-deoxy-D-xylulose-5-phosphate synthase [Schaalia hyovaginalis]MDD7553594.1 1-deoxy-D-xylulose-5-phosphate synthase [Schaalia hyovaginalis]MDY3092946.1 1-deoxy-D-xylulose-5-phosphate synthase [Schaalia hyovaginalis]